METGPQGITMVAAWPAKVGLISPLPDIGGFASSNEGGGRVESRERC